MDFLRSKQAGIQRDLTKSLVDPDIFLCDIVAKFGVPSQISTIAFDPVQSLLAVGTYTSLDGAPGEIHLFGQKRVQVIFKLQRAASVKFLKFSDTKLVVLDSKHDLTIISLETRKISTTYSPPGGVSTVLTEPGLDWVFLGLQNGDVIAYDLDREVLSPFRIPRLWKSLRASVGPVVSLALHPRDVGTLLIGYLEGAVIFSFKQNKPTLFFKFELPAGAPGADTDPAAIAAVRRPKLSHACWHPTGTFVLTAHEDSCMVFWDAKDGRIVQARTLQDSHVNIPGGPPVMGLDPAVPFAVREPIFQVKWCSTANPDETYLLIAGGNSTAMNAKGMALMDFGNTPPYLTSTWQVLSEHFASPKRQRMLPTPPTAEVIDFCLIPRTTPHYNGGHDPVAVLALLASGELTLLRFPDGYPLSPTYLLPISLTFMHPPITGFNVTMFDRKRWLGMEEKREKPPIFLEGGSPLCKPTRRFEIRPVVQTAHQDGTIRIWDASHADEIENADMLEVDLSIVLKRTENLKISALSMSGMTGELTVGLHTGEMIMFNWRMAAAFGTMDDSGSQDGPILDIRARADPRIRAGLLPLFMMVDNHSGVKVLKCSDVGFVAVGFEDGHLAVIDLRGPAIIYNIVISSLTREQKRASFRKSSSHQQQPAQEEVATCLEFAVLTLEEEAYSSIVLFVGTSAGRVGAIKILPGEGGKYKAEFCGATSASLDDPVVGIFPINTETGALALATQYAVLGLRNGIEVPGAVVAVTESEIRIFKAPAAKGVHKGLAEGGNVCLAAGMVELAEYGVALVCAMKAGVLRVYSIPALKEVTDISVVEAFDKEHLKEAKIIPSGEVISLSTPTSLTSLFLFGKGVQYDTLPNDELYNPLTPPPPRPTISNLQWLSGTQYLSLADLDLLIAGPDRPPSKAEREEIEAIRQEQRQARVDARMAARVDPAEAAKPAGTQGGIWAGLQKGFSDRTKSLGLMGESMDRLGESSKGFSDEVARLVKEQKKKALIGGLKSKFF